MLDALLAILGGDRLPAAIDAVVGSAIVTVHSRRSGGSGSAAKVKGFSWPG